MADYVSQPMSSVRAQRPTHNQQPTTQPTARNPLQRALLVSLKLSARRSSALISPLAATAVVCARYTAAPLRYRLLPRPLPFFRSRPVAAVTSDSETAQNSGKGGPWSRYWRSSSNVCLSMPGLNWADTTEWHLCSNYRCCPQHSASQYGWLLPAGPALRAQVQADQKSR